MTNDHTKPPMRKHCGAADKPVEDHAPGVPKAQREHDARNEAGTVPRVLFPLGRVVATPGALEYMERNEISAIELLELHQAGDWGDIGAEDRAENWLSVAKGFRVMSCYRHGPAHEAIWVITEADRSSTTVLLPSDY